MVGILLGSILSMSFSSRFVPWAWNKLSLRWSQKCFIPKRLIALDLSLLPTFRDGVLAFVGGWVRLEKANSMILK